MKPTPDIKVKNNKKKIKVSVLGVWNHEETGEVIVLQKHTHLKQLTQIGYIGVVKAPSYKNIYI